ncbi:MAG TPA: MFS transporter [Terracidiphilus sp.]|jgi:MFS family permease
MQSGRELKAFFPALVLLLLAVLINYADRGNLALAAPMLKDDWHLSTSQLGILLSCFFWSYTVLQIPVGWLVDRFNPAVVLALGFFTWSLSTAASGLASGFTVMLGMRLLLGVGEAVMFPSCSKICSQHLPEHHRGLANALIIAAIRWGTAVGTFGGGLLMAQWGWRRTFMLIGLAGLLWLPAWMIWKPRPVAAPARAAHMPARVGEILSQRSFWGAAMGHFCANYLLYFLMSWLPYYLVHERHLSTRFMAETAALLYGIDSLSSIATGWLADRRIGGGADARLVRKRSMAIGFCIAAVALLAFAAADANTYLPCLVCVSVGSGIASSGPYAMGQTLAGPHLAGRWVGLQNCFANIAGIIGPALTGFLVDRTGSFVVALTLVALVAVMGALSWMFGISRTESAQAVAAEAAV